MLRSNFATKTNWLAISHNAFYSGGMIASVLDVSAGLVCVGNALTRLAPISQEQLEQKLAKMGTIDLRVDYLRPGRGNGFTASSHILRSGNKVSVARVELHNEKQVHIASGTSNLYCWLMRLIHYLG